MHNVWLQIAFYSILASFSLAGCSTSEQTRTPPEINRENVEIVTETTPAIIGGLDALHQQLSYPAHLYQSGTKIILEANVLVDAEGAVNRISFNKDKYPELKAAAREAIRQVRFVPGKRNTEEVDMFVTLPITFNFP